MLHYKTVEPDTLSLLKDLMQIPELNNYCLVGGTALSLKYGHRISVDLDLFSTELSAFDRITEILQEKYGEKFVRENLPLKFALFCKIKNVKTDLVHYPHPLIEAMEVIDGIRFYSDKDIAAMKINAILGRGVKKDFWELYQMLIL